MKRQLESHIKITLTNGKALESDRLYSDRFSPQPVSETCTEMLATVNEILQKFNSTQRDVKRLEFNFSATIEQRQTEEELFFYELLDKTESVFKNGSATHKKYPDENWNFAVCDTPIQHGKGLFFGLNWGGDYKNPQSAYPKKEKDRNWPFISHSRNYFRTYFNAEIEDLNYSNLCFFRSPNMKHFVKSDWNLGIPLFSEYVHFVKPSWALMLGSPPPALKQAIYLQDLKEIELRDTKSNKNVTGYTGTLFGKFPFGSVPHPQARISKEARHAIWEKVTDQMKIKK